MSILDKNKVDAIGISKDGNKIVLMISDHLSWDNEYEHLLLLQGKINDYISFIESGQVSDIYPEIIINKFMIEVHFKFYIIDKCSEFLRVVNQQVNKFGIEVTAEISS